MEPITDTGIARRVTDSFEESPDSERYQLAREAIESGSATIEATEPLLREGVPFVYDGAVYQLSYEITRSKPATSFHITLNPVEQRVDEDETVQYEELPEVDRRKFAARGWDEIDFLGFGTSMLYLQIEIPESALVPEPRRPVIVWDSDTRGRFAVDGSYETALKTYRYTPSVVHPSAAEYGREIRERYGFTLTDSHRQRATS
jgi:hypothetical protein